MKFVKILLVLLFFLQIIPGSLPVRAADHSSMEIRNLLLVVNNKLKKLKEGAAPTYAGKEMSKIEDFVKSAKMFLDDDELDQAYYQISIANVYFKIVEAKKELSNAEKELEKTKADLAIEE
ncbi:MAG: hypothetical protein GY754_40110 [bacterium]|nr:hypothetical protein [bacterium]